MMESLERDYRPVSAKRGCAGLAMRGFLLLVLCLSAEDRTVGQQGFERGKYIGPSLTTQQVAQVFPRVEGDLLSLVSGQPVTIYINKVDDRKVGDSPSVVRRRWPAGVRERIRFNYNAGWFPGPIEVVPGRHTLELRFDTSSILPVFHDAVVVAKPITLTFEAKAGRRYVVDGGTHGFVGYKGGEWLASIVDLESGELVAGVDSLGYVLKNEFVPEQYAPFKQKGHGVIAGAVESLESSENSQNFVLLIPVTPLTEELVEQGLIRGIRIRALDYFDIPMWRSGPFPERGFIKFSKKPPEFKFDDLPAGRYFVLNRIVGAETASQKLPIGIAMAKVTLGDGERVLNVVCARVAESLR